MNPCVERIERFDGMVRIDEEECSEGKVRWARGTFKCSELEEGTSIHWCPPRSHDDCDSLQLSLERTAKLM